MAQKYALIGRWLLAEKQSQLNLTCLAKYDLPEDIKQEHYGLTSGFVYQKNLPC